MKRLLIVSDESILGGVSRCGVSEVVDSLACSLTDKYEVAVLCPDGNSRYLNIASKIETIEDGLRRCKIFGITYYLLAKDQWAVARIAHLVDALSPDILHNFSYPELMSMLTECLPKAILTFDDLEAIESTETYLGYYESVTTFSEAYAQYASENFVSKMRARSVFKPIGVATGILSSIISPEKGLFLPTRYDVNSLGGRRTCKDKLHQTYGIPDNVCVYAVMCRLIDEKGIDRVLEVVHDIRDSGGILLIVGRGNHKYERALSKLSRDDGVIWLQKRASPFQAAPFMAGIDFFLQPSMQESCGLMPMTAARYGAIPILSDIGSFLENFNDDNAIIAYDGDLRGAIQTASRLFRRKADLNAKRKACMLTDFSWDTRKQGYIDLYEA